MKEFQLQDQFSPRVVPHQEANWRIQLSWALMVKVKPTGGPTGGRYPIGLSEIRWLTIMRLKFQVAMPWQLSSLSIMSRSLAWISTGQSSPKFFRGWEGHC